MTPKISLVLLAAGLLSTAQMSKCNEQVAGPTGVIASEKLSFTIDTLAADLEVPWGIAFLPNGDMLFTERNGNLRIMQGGQLHPTPIAGMPEVHAKGQGGLFEVVLHPNYAENGWIYLTYASAAKPGESGEGSNTTVMRARLDGYSLKDQEVIFKASPNYTTNHHYGGRLVFDKAGFMFLTVGDRGEQDEAQLLSTHRGKVLRLKDDGTVPEDNPYVGQADARPEIYSYGHRNPQGLIMHPETGTIWEHEHGPQGGDELNIVQRAHNYGWPVITYGINYNGTIITKDTVREGMDQPVIFWRPSIAPCGMDFVMSDKYGDWKGNLLVGSMKFRYLKRLELTGEKVTHQEILIENIGRIRAVRQGPDGYIYLAIEGPGMIVRLKPAA
ncbi:MAG: PQQ-dependent sugar dehydrogenase [Bacteroidia bacterium]|nr:PQQ-dependent sugar dehydrogenase [Bacteroidia bacterium]